MNLCTRIINTLIITSSLFLCELVIAETESQLIWEPPGELISVGSHRLHILCKGNEKKLPTIIIDSGLGGFSLEWQNLQNILANQYKVCAYDRAGYGWSDPGPFPRTTKRIVYELKILLEAAELEPPYVLLGHSFGGYNMMYYSKQFSDDVAGLILVDSSHPDQANWFPTVFPEFPNGRQRSRYVSMPKLPSNYPYESRNLAYHLMTARKARNALRYESMNFEISGQQLARLGQMPEIPMVVLTRGERAWPETKEGEQHETSWLRLQNELARMSKKSLHVMADYSGHFIHLDQPFLIEEAIDNVVHQIPCGNIELDDMYAGNETEGLVGEC